MEVREQVFCGEQGVPWEEERDELDELAEHLVAWHPDGRVIATLRLLCGDGTAKVGRVAVERSRRRRGDGAADARARARAGARARLPPARASPPSSERSSSTGAWASSVESEPLPSRPGIEHVWMGRELPTRPRKAGWPRAGRNRSGGCRQRRRA